MEQTKEQVTEYDEEYMVAVPNAVINQVREALRFYERERNYEPFRAGIKPILRDRGMRALYAIQALDAIWEAHDRALTEKWQQQKAAPTSAANS